MKRRIAISLGVVIACGCAPWSTWVDEFASLRRLVLHEVLWWTLVVALLAYVRFGERRPLSSVGLRAPRVTELAVGLAAGLATVVVLAVVYLAVFPALGVDESAAADQLLATPLWWRMVSVARAAVSEELVFRGYAIERTLELTGSRRAAFTVPWLVFTFAHVGPWGWGHLLVAGLGGAGFTLLYAWRRNLWVGIIAHVVVDGIAVLTR